MPIKQIILLLCLCLLASLSQAGKLDSLEKEASKPKQRGSSSSSSSSKGNGSSAGDQVSEGMAELIVEVSFKMVEVGITVMAQGGENSMERYSQSSSMVINQDNESNLFRRQGDPLLPTVKVTSQWLDSSSGITAQLNRIEGGFGLIGFSYSENNLDEFWSITRYSALTRNTLPGKQDVYNAYNTKPNKDGNIQVTFSIEDPKDGTYWMPVNADEPYYYVERFYVPELGNVITTQDFCKK